MTIDERLSRVPTFSQFYGTDELYDHAKRVAEANPDICSLTYVGQSKNGEKIPDGQGGEWPDIHTSFRLAPPERAHRRHDGVFPP